MEVLQTSKKEPITQYVRVVYRNDDERAHLTPIHICAAHVLHRAAWKCCKPATDYWSWSMIQSACLAANNMNVTQYLRVVYRNEDKRAHLTPIHICAAHVLYRTAWKCCKPAKVKRILPNI